MIIRDLDYERSTAPLVPIEQYTERRELPASASGVILLIGGLLALAIALAYVGTGTQAQAVAWAFVVAGVIAALRKWA